MAFIIRSWGVVRMKGLIPNTGGFLAVTDEPRKSMDGVFLYSYTPGMAFDVNGGHYDDRNNRINWKYIVVATIGPLSIGAFAPDQFNRVDWHSNAALEQLKDITGFDNSLLKFYVSSVDWKAVSTEGQDIVETVKQTSKQVTDLINPAYIGGLKAPGEPTFYFNNSMETLSAKKESSVANWKTYLKNLLKIDLIDQMIAENYPQDYTLKNAWDSYKYQLLNVSNADNAISAGSTALNDFKKALEDKDDLKNSTDKVLDIGREALYWWGYFYPETLSEAHFHEIYDDEDDANKKFVDVIPYLGDDTDNTIMSSGDASVMSMMLLMMSFFQRHKYTGLGSSGTFHYGPTYETYQYKTRPVIETPSTTHVNGPKYTWGGVSNYFDVNTRYMPGTQDNKEMTRLVEPVYGVVSGGDAAIYDVTMLLARMGKGKLEAGLRKFMTKVATNKLTGVIGIITSLAGLYLDVEEIKATFNNRTNSDSTVGAGTYMDSFNGITSNATRTLTFENTSKETFKRQKRYGFDNEKLGQNSRFTYFNIPINKIYTEVAYLNDSGYFNSNKTQLNKDVWSMVHFKAPGTSQTPQDASTYVNPHWIYGKFNIKMKYEKYFWLLLNKQNRGNA